MKEQKKQPELRFKGFTDDWEQVKLGNIFEKKNELNRNQFTENRTISIATMTFKPSGNGADENSIPKYKVLRLGDIAFEGHKNKDFAFGRFLMNDIGDGIISPRFTFLHAKEKLDIDFWKYYIHHESIMRTILVKSTKQGTMMNELVVTDFLKQGIKVPEKSEQKIIGIFLTRLDHTITLQQRKRELLKKLKRGYLQQMFPAKDSVNPQLRFNEFNSNWEPYKLGEIAEIVGGGTPSTGVPEYWDGDIDWYSPTEIGESIYVAESLKKITESGLNKSSAKMLPTGTILFTSRAGIGNTAILAKTGSTNQGFQSILPKRNILDSYFIFSRTTELKKYGEITGAGSTFIEVSGKQMAQMPICIPCFEEQKKIGIFFQKLDHGITLQQSKVDKLKNLKQAYLQKLFP